MLLPSLSLATLLISANAKSRLDKPDSSAKWWPNPSMDCYLPKEEGPCRSDIPRFYFDPKAWQCKPFHYGGCEGNANNYETELECQETCMAFPTPTVAPQRCTATFLTNVEALEAKFNEFNEAPDVFDSFDRLGEESRELFRLATPVGKCLLTAVSENWEENSDEARALEKLHGMIKDGVREESEWTYKVPIMRVMANATAPYRNVSAAAGKIRSITNLLYNVIIRPIFLMDPFFSPRFYNIHALRTITGEVNYTSLVSCRTPNGKELAKFTKVQDAINSLTSRLNSTQAEMIGEYWEIEVKDISRDSLRAPSEYVNKMVDLLNAVNVSSLPVKYNLLGSVIYKAMSETFYKLRGPARNFPELCPNLPQTFEINQTVFLSELAKIRGDLLRIMLISSMVEAKKSPLNNADFTLREDYDVNGHALTAIGETGKKLAEWAREIRDFSG